MDVQEFRAERNTALLALDMAWARRMLPKASNDIVLLMALHKGRYECVDLPDEPRRESGAWLLKEGLTRMDGSAVLLNGELPE